MHDPLEHILADIYTLDPSLKENEGEVRVLVSALIEAKPDVVPSEIFVQELRTKLQTGVVSHVAHKPVLSPWIMYLTPVGIMAILVLMLVPEYLTAPTHDDTGIVLPMMLEESAGTQSTESLEMGDMKRSAPVQELYTPTLMQDSSMESQESTLFIPTQPVGNTVFVEYVSLSQSGFVVIETSEDGQPGKVVGVSILLAPGYTSLLQIPLFTPMGIDQTFFATVYLDNGDGRFTPGVDTPHYDSSGTLPLQQMFSTMPGTDN